MTQAAFDFDAPAVPTFRPSKEAPKTDARPKCENMMCANPVLPGRQMCGECLGRFSPMAQRIIERKW